MTGNNPQITGVSGGILTIGDQTIQGNADIGFDLIDIVTTVEARIIADSTSTIDPAGTDAWVNNGLLYARGGDIVCQADVINNGVLQAEQGEQVRCNSINSSPGSLITGNGSVRSTSQEMTISGTVAPGNSIGTLTFSSSSPKLVNNATLEIELSSTSGTPGVDWDLVNIGGTLQLVDDNLPSAVKIELVSLNANGEPGALSSFDPQASFSIQIVDATEIEGFNIANFEVDTTDFANSFGGSFYVSHDESTDSLMLNYIPIRLGDVNGDGAVNLLDVSPFVQALSNGTFVDEADINRDGVVNLLDVGPFVSLLSN